jgi:hypothetical protein
MKNVRIIVAVAVVSAVHALGCGGNGASNNDQGISVSFLGLFQSTTSQNSGGSGNNQSNLTGCGQLPQPLAAGFISVGQTFLTPTGTPQPGTQGLSVDPSGAVYAIVGLQNNMFGQVFRADRVLLQYYIPGAKIQPPSTNVAVNLLAGPAESGLGSGGTNTPSLRRPHVTSLPPTFSQVCNRAFAQVPIIPGPVHEWLIFNSNLLPEPPYDLEVVVSLTGLSSGGNRYDTNEGLFTIGVIPEIAVVPPTPSASASSTSTTDSATSEDTSNSTDTTTLSVREESDGTSDAQGLDELERAFEAESVVEGQ